MAGNPEGRQMLTSLFAEIKQRRAWLLIGWVTAEYLISGSKVILAVFPPQNEIWYSAETAPCTLVRSTRAYSYAAQKKATPGHTIDSVKRLLYSLPSESSRLNVPGPSQSAVGEECLIWHAPLPPPGLHRGPGAQTCILEQFLVVPLPPPLPTTAAAFARRLCNRVHSTRDLPGLLDCTI
ncbi:hypothetical protein J6590_004295 [Homalodisca vitripennis]|nr:hypothetical protein J6590_004295 [Homalodisca vitripennis]